jgi:HPt (histidine-containing phosphotransfer) domain-containing protein
VTGISIPTQGIFVMTLSLPENSLSGGERCSPPPSPSVLNLAALRDRCLGNESLVTQILSKLETAVRSEGDRIGAAWAAGDFSAVVAVAHRLKGTAGNVGAEALGQAAAQLELAARARETSATSQAIERLDAEIGRLAEAMNQHSDN